MYYIYVGQYRAKHIDSNGKLSSFSSKMFPSYRKIKLRPKMLLFDLNVLCVIQIDEDVTNPIYNLLYYAKIQIDEDVTNPIYNLLYYA